MYSELNTRVKFSFMKRILWIFVILNMLFIDIRAQDIHWSQFEYAPLNLNAAHTGLFSGDYRFAGNYRSQWFDVPVAYRTISLTFDAHLLPFKLEDDVWGVGFTFNHDQAGDSELSTLNLLASMAYTKRITKFFFIGAGVQLGFSNRRFKLNNLTFNDQYNGDVFDPNIVSYDQTKFSGNNNVSYFDINTGINFRFQMNKRLWANLGAGVFHLTQPKVSFLGDDAVMLPIRFNISLNGSVPVSERFDILPVFLFQKQLVYQEVLYGASAKYHFNLNPGREMSAELGFVHRWDDALIVKLGFAYQNWHFGLSYDINVSGFQTATRGNGGYELSVIHIWSKVPDLGSVKTCPIF